MSRIIQSKEEVQLAGCAHVLITLYGTYITGDTAWCDRCKEGRKVMGTIRHVEER